MPGAKFSPDLHIIFIIRQLCILMGGKAKSPVLFVIGCPIRDKVGLIRQPVQMLFQILT
ncbi:hypothetical protein GXY_09649 [Novacetimonas hansenii ATCC 23769]|uniref:Uncharacterized protein n=1 Tax=Novacetimonas hansenii ATCC 23769 TaxID=714995 RepID=D5QFL0_NOVHA|nr:hypothetical protein GXY_09649 [Novacetimonas hansenii ATCC 23769]